jgi:mRNA interferase MazF
VIVLSHDVFNTASNWRSVIVIPISSSPRQAARGPTVIPLPKGTAGLSQDSVAVCHQITTLDRSKLTQRIGELPPNLLATVEIGLKAAVDLK